MNSEASELMRWMVGVDARHLAGGAVAFARWLAQGHGNDVLGVHVVEWVPSMQHRLEHAEPDDVRSRAADALRTLEQDAHFTELGAIVATAAEDGLETAVDSKKADALVLGRRAPRSGSGVVRLGRVARRMLRRLPVPVIIVPPDLETIGDGPVVLAVDLTESCGHAATIAARIATAMGRDLVLMHAIHPPDRGPYFPAEVWDLAMSDLRDRSEQGFLTWADRHGVGAAERIIIEGPPVQMVVELAEERDACLLVVGSRQLGGLERLFLSSLGSELAASSPRPVAVVPPR